MAYFMYGTEPSTETVPFHCQLDPCPQTKLSQYLMEILQSSYNNEFENAVCKMVATLILP